MVSTLQKEERKAQDIVAPQYEHVRYALPWSRAYHDWLFRRMIALVKPAGDILDAGCGNGLLGEYLPDHRIWGIDISEQMVRFAKPRLHDVRVGDVQHLPYESSRFDTIFARAIIHHLEDPVAGLSELARVLKPSGRIIFMDTRETIFSRKPRQRMLEGEHFSHVHKNMNERDYRRLIDNYFVTDRFEYIGYVAYTLLGFPDIVNIYAALPFKKIITPLLIYIDRVWSRIPLLQKAALGMLLVAHKKS